MIITISGMPGSGKTSAAKIIAQKLGMPFYSVGSLRGKMALERGMTIDELNKVGEADHTTDTTVDDYQRELGKKEDNFVIEGRLSWHFIPNSVKVFLTCDEKEAAHRIFLARQNPAEGRNDEPAYPNEEAAEQSISARIASDVLRYQKYYQIDYREPANYDIVIDTTAKKSAQETADAVLVRLPIK